MSHFTLVDTTNEIDSVEFEIRKIVTQFIWVIDSQEVEGDRYFPTEYEAQQDAIRYYRNERYKNIEDREYEEHVRVYGSDRAQVRKLYYETR